jgi:hypothetical protein
MAKKLRQVNKKNKSLLLFLGILIILILALFIVHGGITKKSVNPGSPNSSSGNTNNPKIRYEPLTADQVQIVTNTILSSQFAKDIPADDPISLTFYTFENGQRIWQNEFLIGNDQILTSGNPGASIIIDSEYISELNGNNLCDIIQEANKNRDLGFSSPYSTTTLFIKYASLLKDRSCLGL